MEFINTEEAAKYLGLSVSTLEHYRAYGKEGGPVFYKKGKVTRYLKEDLNDWIATGRIDPEERV